LRAAAAHLASQLSDVVLGETRHALEDVRQRPSVHVLHEDGDRAVVQERLVVLYDERVVGVVQRAQLHHHLLAQLLRAHVELDHLHTLRFARRLGGCVDVVVVLVHALPVTKLPFTPPLPSTAQCHGFGERH
jgi:hypothetical protein